MTWGPSFMYYCCPVCGKKFKYALDLLSELGEDFGKCPTCNIEGVYEMDGAIIIDDNKYEEIE